MIVLAALLAIDAALHAILVYLYGVKENMSVFVYVFIFAMLSLAVFFVVPFALWATLVLSLIGFTGLNLTFNRPKRDKTIDKTIWAADAASLVCTAYLLFLR